MVIKASTSAEVRHLIDALGGPDDVAREAAAARLAIIGPRAVDRLVAAYEDSGSPVTRNTILRILEWIADPRALVVAERALAEGGELALAGVATLRGLLSSSEGTTGTTALDRLVSIAMDRGRERRVRLAAFEALRDVPGDAVDQLKRALTSDDDAGIRAYLAEPHRDAAAVDATWQDALEGKLPALPAELREAVVTRAASAPLGALQALIDAVRVREGGSPAWQRADWQGVRGTLHQALALRGSHVAVYDLRETLEDARGPLPASFVAALHTVGDETCLEPIAAAHAAATDARWRFQLAEAFRAIARRERITARSAALKRIVGKWPDAATFISVR